MREMISCLENLAIRELRQVSYSVIIHYFNTPEHRVILYILGALVVRSTEYSEYTFIEVPKVVHPSGWA
jgi:hypothetical protein